MHFLIIPDSFKDSLTAREIIDALKAGLKEANEHLTTTAIVASDGGEGFLAFVQGFVATTTISVKTVDPLGREIVGEYAFAKASKTAYIELAKASGIELLAVKERNPLHTSTYGTGMQIKDAIARGAKEVYIGLGGSATNDGGIGMAAALGYQFLDESGRVLEPLGKNLNRIAQIQKPKNLQLPKIYAINDVDNVLTGKQGAAHIYGKQKGATPAEILQLDEGLVNLGKVVQRDLQLDLIATPGAGAAGGSGYGLHVFFKARFVSGVSFLIAISGVQETLSNGKFDAIITGEGCIDEQTLRGKLVKGVASLGQQYTIPVYVICGVHLLRRSEMQTMGITNTWAVRDLATDTQDSYRNAAIYLQELAKKIYDKHLETG